MAAQGWLGIHLPEEFGGQGFGLFELAVVLEETGRSMVPGPAPAHRGHLGAGGRGGANRPAPARFLPGLIDGTTPAALSFGDVGSRAWSNGAPAARSTVSGTLAARAGSVDGLAGAGPGPPDATASRSGACWRCPDRTTGCRWPPWPASIPPAGWAWSSVESVTVAAERQLRVAHRPSGPPGGGHADGGRARRRCPLVSRDGHRVRQGAGAVRPTDRAVPGGQAPAGRHGRPGRADDRGGLGRGPGRGRRRRRRRRVWRPPPPVPWRSTGTPERPRSACSCWAGSVSPGSTTSTCTSSGPWPTDS